MARISSLCVYCGSSDRGDVRHRDWAGELGREAAQRAIRIVFGGGHVGLMGEVADAALAAGGEVIGVIPEHLRIRELGHGGLTRMEVVESMHERKARMCALADAFCVLPGGLGTLDEAFEIITWKQLDLHDKPIVLLNQAGFWQPFLDLVAHQVAEGYIRAQHAQLFAVAETVAQVFEVLADAPEPRAPERQDQL